MQEEGTNGERINDVDARRCECSGRSGQYDADGEEDARGGNGKG